MSGGKQLTRAVAGHAHAGSTVARDHVEVESMIHWQRSVFCLFSLSFPHPFKGRNANTKQHDHDDEKVKLTSLLI